MTDTARPTAGTVEERHAPVPDTLSVAGPRLRGVIPYGVQSRDLGGFTEVIEPGALRGARLDDLVATVDHAGVPIGRHPRTLDLEDRADGLHWSVDLPESRQDVREAVERGDLRAGSWRMVVGRDEWRGDVRHVHEISELRDVAVVTSPAYPAAVTEWRSGEQSPGRPSVAPDSNSNNVNSESENTVNSNSNSNSESESRTVNSESETTTVEARHADAPGPGLRVEDRAADTPSVEARVLDALRSVRKGEARSLSVAADGSIAPAELSTFLFDALRASSIALASGIRVIATDRQSISWPQLTADMVPAWYGEADTIVASDPTFATLVANPHKLAARVEMSNDVIDDSDPSILDVLRGHVATILGLRLDQAIFQGDTAVDADSITGLANVTGIQTFAMGANGAALTDYDPLLSAIGLLRAANVQPPFAVVANPSIVTELSLLRRETGSNEQLARPAGVPEIRTSTQLSIAETQGTATDAASIYIYSPNELVLVRRQDAEIELDRSRLFDTDSSELRGKLRCDLIVPNPQAIVRITGIIPAA